jgi:hypothetical protein
MRAARVDAPVDPKIGHDLENSILARARQIRLNTPPNQWVGSDRTRAFEANARA